MQRPPGISPFWELRYCWCFQKSGGKPPGIYKTLYLNNEINYQPQLVQEWRGLGTCPLKRKHFKRTFYHLTINFQWIYDMIPSWELTYPHPRYVWRWFFPFPKSRWDMYVSSLEGSSTFQPLFHVLQELAGIHSKWFEWMSGLWKFPQILSKFPLIF